VLFPPAALLPLVDTGLGDNNACSRAYQAQKVPGDATPKSGSSAPPQAARAETFPAKPALPKKK
jgi:hypothetical protein